MTREPLENFIKCQANCRQRSKITIFTQLVWYINYLLEMTFCKLIDIDTRSIFLKFQIKKESAKCDKMLIYEIQKMI